MGASFFILGYIILNFARYVMIFIISKIVNCFRTKRTQITRKFQFFMWFSGFRGAMAFALSMNAIKDFQKNQIGNIMLTFTLLYAMTNVK